MDQTGTGVRQLLLALFGASLCWACSDRASLELTLRDAATGEPTPARVELSAADGRQIIPDDTLRVFADCGRIPFHNWVPWAATAEAMWDRQSEVRNPYTGTSQFYTDGTLTAKLPPGRYTLTVDKGIEYDRITSEIVVEAGTASRVQLDLTRWIDLPSEGWYAADDHLHIPRVHRRFDPEIAMWMQAEDIHVANMLQMGLSRDVHITPQHEGFGARSVYRDGNTILMSGQENPRTHVLGHSIILGAGYWIDFPSSYLAYDRFWQAANEQGAVTGYAHWGLAGAEEGLAVWAHRDLLDFIEVLNLGFPFYERWYEALDLGLRIGPTAGTDYPCLPSLPGRERFYTKLDGPLNAEAWLDGVRRGRTFVTNGPIPELIVNGAQAGAEVRLRGPGPVRVRGRVRFDPDRDEVTQLELIRGGGEVIHTVEDGPPGELSFEMSLPIERSTWLAVRASGAKRGETLVPLRDRLSGMLVLERRTNEVLTESLPAGPIRRLSSAHTGAIWITVDGTPPIARQLRAREVSRDWLKRLSELEARFGDGRIDDLAGFPGRGDGIASDNLLAERPSLIDAIEAARWHHGGVLTFVAPPDGARAHVTAPEGGHPKQRDRPVLLRKILAVPRGGSDPRLRGAHPRSTR